MINNNILNKMIQKLGFWTSKILQLYFKTSFKFFYNLKFGFKKYILLIVSRVLLPKKKDLKYLSE